MSVRHLIRCALLIGAVVIAGSGATTAIASTAQMSLATASTPSPRQRSAANARVALARSTKLLSDIDVVSGLSGEPGYIHYFVITGAHGESETQVGIETEDGRIAWSFPGTGVSIAPFIASGSVTTQSTQYHVEHLYGLRPFRDRALMRLLQRDLTQRIRTLLAEHIPFCDESGHPARLCVSCLGFVLRVIFPGPTQAFPAVPAHFKHAYADRYSTEDLLLYLTGVPLDAPRSARTRRIQELFIPESLREELTRISDSLDAVPATAKAKPRRTVAKGRTGDRRL